MNYETKHCVEQALKAHVLFHRDKDYVVKEGQVIIVDEFTGRLMPGRRWSDGLHQAVEAKERVKIERENQTLATITFQNYFRMYKKLAGMTGTADTEAAEFGNIYKLDVDVIPTNRPLIRKEHSDIVYRTEEEKFRNAAKEIKEYTERGQPVLVGTISIEKSEKLSKLLKKMGVKHEVLNAKQHEREAKIVAQAGRKGAVTVSTNMAGRGTDILLGGNAEFTAREQLLKKGKNPDLIPREEWEAVLKEFKKETDREHDEVVALGGLHILGTERHESRRIDNQLRGRAGRQGDPGSSRFYLSLQDDLLRIFGGEKVQNLMLRLGMEEDVPIESRLITKRIEAAQKAVEAQNFEARKHLLEYDDVMNKQREAVYGTRRKLLEGKDQKEYILNLVGRHRRRIRRGALPREGAPRHVRSGRAAHRHRERSSASTSTTSSWNRSISRPWRTTITEYLSKRYEEKEAQVGTERLRYSERMIMLQILDSQWKDHLLSMDHLKEGIGLRGYGQKDPLVEYKKESFTLFQDMMTRFEEETIKFLFYLQARTARRPGRRCGAAAAGRSGMATAPSRGARGGGCHGRSRGRLDRGLHARHSAPEGARAGAGADGRRRRCAAAEVKQVVRGKKVGRNDPCPCGSGKKYKKCCGRIASKR